VQWLAGTGLRVGMAAGLMMGATCAIAAVAHPLAALDGLETGEWELRVRGQDGPVRRLCLGDRRQLLQPQHPGRECGRFVVADKANQLVVTYDCAGAGNGRTDLRVETPRLAQIQSQGISGGAPFSYAIEARRVGECQRPR